MLKQCAFLFGRAIVLIDKLLQGQANMLSGLKGANLQIPEQ